ncbi:F0F1 ATP synthase subunit gamma [Amphiplicatus metriothermophilus]|uniref:ATP synthase gamma chain n=1 Tax=Amphiplicatus metriothermophilus TaxID=1519374 RepID=A0A239PJH8_9PROT|nr:F0F1 ATP synthase subunit gamma [Amphiplicatus metriothermophilus]MBB5517891.1 F-type H+-transporting ATPase subunit gamma [Amphiplicatus metriothermophilus]SNT67775.1 ATP synthase F1 subcomplex gamma subunit [Amphiplicatus metriothermophilus]
MPSLKALKNRIDSVKSTKKITKAMQMVASAKLRRAEDAAKAARPYTERMEAVLANLAASAKDNPAAPKLLAGTGKDDAHLLIVATADKGLCGAFNSSIVRLARERIVKLQGEGKTVKIICVGRKGYDQLKRLYADLVVWRTDFLGVRRISFGEAQEIAARVLEMFDKREFDVAAIFYGKFKSVISQVPTAQQIIPAVAPEGAAPPDLKGAIYAYEPDEEEILKTLLPRYVSVQIFRALLENVASEMGAKMTAMDNATRNAGEMIDKLTLQYNRARQAQITKELIEIISGAEAL